MGTPILQVVDAFKSYGNNRVIAGLNMTVYKGQIYSLLGASGCGKTTLLSCIVGVMELDQGKIDLDLSSRLQLGYMPQDIALHDDLRIREAFYFFGLMSGLSNKVISERLHHLSNLVELPPSSSKIDTLSGGEKRRLSLAVALLGNPELLILDEPTVGVDILLRESIWNYLYDLTNGGTTIIITTHYIEEAKDCHRVAFMRDGRLLKEDSPSQIKASLQVNSLEEAFLIHCTRQEACHSKSKKPAIEEENTASVNKAQDNFEKKKPFSNEPGFKKNRILAMILKNVYSLKNNMILFYFGALLPAVLFIVLVFTTQAPTNLRISYFNEENNCLMDRNERNCDTPFSCRYMDYLQQRGILLVKYNDYDAMMESVIKGNTWGGIRMFHNFTDSVNLRLDYLYNGEEREIQDVDEAHVFMDMSNYIVSYYLRKAMADGFFDAVEEWYTMCGLNPKTVRPILRIEKPIHGYLLERGCTDTIAPMLALFLPCTSAVSLGAIFVLIEKETGTLNRCKVLGLKMAELMVSQFVAVLFIVLPAGIILILVMYCFVEPKGYLYLQGIIFFLSIVMSVLQGLFVSLISKDLSVALQMSNMSTAGQTWFSGMFWPMEGYLPLGKIVAVIMPFVYPSKTMMELASREQSFSSPDVYRGFISVTCWILIFCLSIWFCIKKNK